jgi:DnaK suppressor protein
MRESELKFFEDTLLARKKQIELNIAGACEEIDQLRGLETNDDADSASIVTDNIVDNAIGHQQEKELKEIELSIGKIKNGGYGICDMCEEDIGMARLKVKPHAKYCIDCREIAEKNSNV